MTMATRPSSTGRKPLSPPRTRASQILAYSPKESAMISGVAAAAGSDAIASASAASRRASWTSVLTGAPCGGLGRDGGQALRGTRGHQVDDGLGVEYALRPERDHAGRAQYGHPVRDGEDVVQVVRDDDDRDALGPQPRDELEHDAGLGTAQRRGRVGQDITLRI